MAMTPAATVAAQIVSDLAVPPQGVAVATTEWIAIITRIQAMIRAGTVNTTITAGVAAGVQSGVSTAVVTGPTVGSLT